MQLVYQTIFYILESKSMPRRRMGNLYEYTEREPADCLPYYRFKVRGGRTDEDCEKPVLFRDLEHETAGGRRGRTG